MKRQSEFIKNVMTLMSGAGLAQVIPIMISPILTRLFTPEEFGLLGFYLALVSVLAILSTGRYELAIILPKRIRSSIQLLHLSMFLTAVTCAFSYLIIAIFYEKIIDMINLKGITVWIWLIPTGVFFTSCLQSFNYFFVKLNNYKLVAMNKVFQALITAAVNISVAVFSIIDFGLIIGSLIGTLLSFHNYIYSWRNSTYKAKPSRKEILILARRYKDFSKYGVFSAVFNNLSSNSPVILLSLLFNSSYAGFFSLANRILMLPMSVVGGSVMQVFLKEVSEKKADLEFIQNITTLTIRRLFYIGFVPMIVLGLFGEELFSFIFGEKWRTAGLYAQYLMPLIYMVFVISPISSLLISLEKQKESLVFNIAIFISRVLALYFGWYFFNTPESSLIFYVIVSFLMWLFLLIYIYTLLGKNMYFIFKDISIFITSFFVLYYVESFFTYGI